jgi:Tol biopolymer transport system component
VNRAVAVAVVTVAAGGTAFAASAGSEDRRETPRAAPAAARDRLAISQQGIVLIDPSGRNKRILTRHRGWLDEDPTWSPDGSRIAFKRTKNEYRSFQIYVKRVAGGPARRLTDGRFDEYPAWSPDGRVIVFNSMGGLKAIRPDGSGERRMARLRGAGEVDWSPDGSRITFTRDGWVRVARRDGTRERRVVRGRAADWSPDGRKLAYMPPRGGVATIGANGRERRFLTNGMLPAWSPDGKRIAFQRWPLNRPFTVWVMSAEGRHIRRVTRAGAYPAWRPLPR